MVLTLIGLRGTGKSSVGRSVAARLGWEFVDADAAVEEHAGKTIAEIFADDGEPTFRQLEVDVLEKLLGSQSSLVLAAGGGAVLSELSRERMRRAGPVAWLTAPTSVLAERLVADDKTDSQRPSLTGKAVADELDDVLKVRRSLYMESATITVPTEHHGPEELAADIVTRLAADLVDSGTEEVGQ